MITVARPAPAPRFNVLRTIAVYKLVKVLLLLALAYGEVRLSDASLAAKLGSPGSSRSTSPPSPSRHSTLSTRTASDP